VAQAEKAGRADNLEEAIRLLDQALAAEPNHRAALYLRAAASTEQASARERPQSTDDYLAAGRAMRRLRDTYKDLNAQEHDLLRAVLYKEACAYAVGGQPDKALNSLSEAIDAGFDQAGPLAEDPELAPIRKLPRFAELSRAIEEKALVRARDNARTLVAETRHFPFRFELPDLRGKTVSLEGIHGKIILVDLWGTWCPPCRKQIPVLKELLRRHRDQGLAIVGINYERAEGAAAQALVQAFVQQNEIPYPCLIGDDRTREQVPDLVGYPTTLFLDRSGIVRAKTAGYHSLEDLDAIVTLLLQEGPP
jgi:thiol-disulfide isomerase/thioredoxin